MLLLLFACTTEPAVTAPPPPGERSWWEQGDDACPEGTALRGVPWPTDAPITPPPPTLSPDEQHRYLNHYNVWCDRGSRFQDREGPFISWYGNGQPSLAGQQVEGQAVEATQWDEFGRETSVSRCTSDTDCTRQVTWWHDNGNKAITGTITAGVPEGRWKEWDDNGTLIGEVVFSAGEPAEVIVATSPFLANAPITGANYLTTDIPHSSTWHPMTLGFFLIVDGQNLVLDGVRVLQLTAEGHIPEELLRGAMVTHLYDRLQEKIASHKRLPYGAGPPTLVLSAPPETSSATVRHLLYTAGSAGIPRQQVLVRNPSSQLPPRTGPPRLQGRHLLHSIPVSLPIIGAEPSGEVIQITTEGYSFPAAPAIPCMVAGCPIRDSYNTTALTAYLATLEAEGTIIIPDLTIDLQTLISTIDAAHAAGLSETTLAWDK